MKKRRIFLVLLFPGGSRMAGMAHAAASAPQVIFHATDNHGSWFDCANTSSSTSGAMGCVPESVPGMSEQKSLAIFHTGDVVGFSSTAIILENISCGGNV